MINLFPFDEIDAFKARLQQAKQPNRETKDIESMDLSDEVLDLLIMAYVYGTDAANEMLGTDYEPDMDEMRSTIELKIDGKDFRQRVSEHIAEGRPDLIGTVADTDSVRVYNTAALNTAIKAGATNKTWHTMEDERVRDTHDPLDNVTVPIDAYFYTYDDDKAVQPGMFSKVENNANCRCWLSFS